MNNTISLIMLGLIVAVCVNFTVKMWRERKQHKNEPEQNQEDQLWAPVFFLGAGVGFFGGASLGGTYPQIFFSREFLRTEGGAIAAILLLAMIFSVICGLAILPLYSYLRKRA